MELASAAALFRSLGDPARLAIVRRLATGAARVVDLTDELGVGAGDGLGALGVPARLWASGLASGGPGVGIFADPAGIGRAVGRRRGGIDRDRQRGRAVSRMWDRAGPCGAINEATGRELAGCVSEQIAVAVGQRGGGPGQRDRGVAVHRGPHPVGDRRAARAAGPSGLVLADRAIYRRAVRGRPGHRSPGRRHADRDRTDRGCVAGDAAAGVQQAQTRGSTHLGATAGEGTQNYLCGAQAAAVLLVLAITA